MMEEGLGRGDARWFLADDPVHRRLREIDVNQLTPLAALTLLADLKREAEQ